MNKMLINKELLSEYKELLIVLENCDVYEIPVDDILDVFCEAEAINNGKLYRTTDGFIKISAKASQTMESFDLKNHKTNEDSYYTLKERLEMCDGGADMTSFALRHNKGNSIDIYVPYDPLEDIMHGGEIELSNCPSFEIDDEGNMIIAFGKRSKQPRRKDNNYAELIGGWKDVFGDYEPKVLKVKACDLVSFGYKQENFSFSFDTYNKNAKKIFVELVFIDCKDVVIEMHFPQMANCEIFTSKMADGSIYVGFYGLGIRFICSSILEHNYYCSQISN